MQAKIEIAKAPAKKAGIEPIIPARTYSNQIIVAASNPAINCLIWFIQFPGFGNK